MRESRWLTQYDVQALGGFVRGPGMRMKLDVRRRWRCPLCDFERRLPASVTSVRCSCSSDAPFMKIVEGQRRPRPTPEPLNPYLEFEPDAETESPIPKAEPDPAAAAQPADVAARPEVAPKPEVTAAESSEASAPPAKSGGRRGKPRRQRDRNRRSRRNRANSSRDTAPRKENAGEPGKTGNDAGAGPGATASESGPSDTPTKPTEDR